MTDNFLARQVKRFDGTGYQGWKFQITAVLMANDIFNVVDGTRVKPANQQGDNGALTKAWIRDNAKAMAIIASAMENAQLKSILVCTSAKDMWDRLNRIHEQKSATNKLILTQRFHEYRMCPTDSVVQHCSKVQNMAKQLTDLGEPVSDLTVMAKILASLTTKFSTLQTAWDNVNPERQTIDNLQERLIREESRLDASGDKANALTVTKQSGFKTSSKTKDNKKKHRPKKNVECFRCQEKGHYAMLNINVWHKRLGHIHKRALCELVNKDMVEGVRVKNTKEFFCEACQLGKLHKLPFKRLIDKSNRQAGEFIHSDVCGPMSVQSLGGARFSVTFKDDFNGFRHVYFLRHKSDVLVLKNMNGWCRILNLWAEAVNTAVYTLNRTGLSRTGGSKTPFELWTGKKPNLSHMRIFGSEAYVHVLNQLTKKLDARAKKMILVGYQGESANYRLYSHETKNVSISRDVVFQEQVEGRKLSEPEISEAELMWPNSTKEKDNKSDAGVTIKRFLDERDSIIIYLIQSAHALSINKVAGAEGTAIDNEVVDRGPDNIVPTVGNERNVSEVREHRPATAGDTRTLRDRALLKLPARYEINIAEYHVPEAISEAVSGPEGAKWKQAIEYELEAHERNKTWTLMPRVSGEKTIDSKWVFKALRNEDGSVWRFKARLCARGFQQREGVDYIETFSPVVRYDSLRVLLATITQDDLEAAQFDVGTAFLHRDLQENIRMEVPVGLDVSKEMCDRENLVCKLNKSLYGLKQAPRCWNIKFSSFLRRFNFKETNADKCIFFGEYEGSVVYLALFVDDGIIAAKSNKVLESIIKSLKESFNITLGNCSCFVGLQILRDRENRTMFIHQTAYAKQLINKFGMKNAKEVSVPADPHTVLYPVVEYREKDCKVPYRKAVGSLMFLAIVSRPDIAYAVNNVSKFLNNYDISHWQAVKRIISYLTDTIGQGIEYRGDGGKCELMGFSDADYAGDIGTRRSTTGYAFLMANGLVSWSSQRQKLVSMSTTESEYIATSTASREATWVRSFLYGIGPVSPETGRKQHATVVGRMTHTSENRV
ncbi:putative retrotransposon, partial [Lasius niger]